MNQLIKNSLFGVGMFAFMMLLAAASALDYEQEESENAHYCEMVEAGAWPDYNRSIEC